VIRLLLIALGLALWSAAIAAAEPVDVTAQARAAHADFLLQATPPVPAAVICLVDTGVTPNPDTSGVIDRLALEGAISDQSPTAHGTRMAMFIGAPANGWGMVGIWPYARIVSVRANVAGADAFTPAGYNFGLKQCDKDATFYGIKVAVLPLSSETALTPDENEALNGTISAARAHGLNVVVAAGNNDGRAPGTPANLPGALSIGASSTGTGALCAFSSVGALLTAPGCGLDGADALTGQATTLEQGTSHAAAIVAASLAALRTWRPDLSPDAAEALFTDNGARRQLDVGATFTAAGLGALVPPAASVVPGPEPSPTPPPPSEPAIKPRLPKPKLSVRTTGGGAKRALTVRVANRPARMHVTVQVFRRQRSGKLKLVASRTRTSSTIRIRVRSWQRVTVRFSDPSGKRLTSPSTVYTRR
jgi:hypothetical protein